MADEDLQNMARRDLNAVVLFGQRAIDHELYGAVVERLIGNGDFAELISELKGMSDRQRRTLLALSIEAQRFCSTPVLFMYGLVIGMAIQRDTQDKQQGRQR